MTIIAASNCLRQGFWSMCEALSGSFGSTLSPLRSRVSSNPINVQLSIYA